MRRRAAKDSTEGHIWGDEVIGYPDKYRIRVVTHIIIIWLEEIGLEKRVLEVSWKAFDNIVSVASAEK
jgi:hypothetical protein